MRVLHALLPVLVVATLLAACSSNGPGTAPAGPAPKRLELVSAESRIHFIGIKNNAVAVAGRFAGLSGHLDTRKRNGTVEVQIGSLATGDVARDENIRTHLFAVAQHPVARFVVDSVTGAETLPDVGSSVAVRVAGQLELRRMLVELTIPMRLTREGAARVRLVSNAPVVLTSAALGLEDAFGVLKAVCGHEALSGAVPVEFDLVFEGAPG